MPDIRRRAVLGALLLLCALAVPAWAQTPPAQTPPAQTPPAQTPPAQTPPAQSGDAVFYPAVETGLHEGDINRIALLPGTDKETGAGTIVTASDDKSVRLWSADSFAPRGVVRPPVGEGDEGKVYAVATTAKWLAVAGRLGRTQGGYAIQFYALPSLRPAGGVSLPRPTVALRFSPSGGTLAAGLMGGGGVWLFDMANLTGQPLDLPYPGDVAALDFGGNGMLVVSGKDDGIRLYSPDHRRLDSLKPAGMTPFGAAFSADGRLVAVGDRNRATVHLFSVSPAGRLQKLRDLQGAPQRLGAMEAVAISADGATVFGAGSYKDLSGQRMVRRWSIDGRAALETAVATDTVTDLLPVGDTVFFSSAEPSFGRIDGLGRLALKSRSHHADFRNAGDASFRLSADGAVIEMPIGQQLLGPGAAGNAATLVFDVRAHAPIPPQAAPPLALPRTSGNGVVVTDWRNSAAPRINGRQVPLDPDETVHAAAVMPAGSAVVMGTDFYVRYLLPSGQQIWRTITEAAAWAVNVSQDGRLVVAGLGDGSVHWYDATDGHEVQALFVDPPTGRWVLWTPDGFFDHDHRVDGLPDGRSLIGYAYNLPNHRSAGFVAVGQMYARFFRPDLVGLAFRDDNVAAATLADQRRRVGTIAATVSQGLPPTISVVDTCGRESGVKSSGCPDTRSMDAAKPADHPGATLSTTADSLLVEYRLNSADGKLGTVTLRRNGAVIRPAVFVDDEDDHSRTEEAVVPLGDGPNVIRLTPVSASGGVESPDAAVAEMTVFRAPKPAAPAVRSDGTAPPPVPPPASRPHTMLYLLSVGISSFTHAELNLANADKDAEAVARLMSPADPPVYDDVWPKTLLNGQATAANILAELANIAAHATPDDLVVVFLAGHGQAVDGKYYFAPADLGTRDPALFDRVMHPAQPDQAAQDQAVNQLFRQEGLGQDKILALVQTIRANRVALILDTCYSASIATSDAVFRRDLNSTVTNAVGNAGGRFVLSSATTLAFDSGQAGAAAGTPTDSQGHGLFTSYLLQALNGAADFNHKGTIDTYKLAIFTQDGVKQATANMSQEQLPEYFFNGNQFFALRTVTPP